MTISASTTEQSPGSYQASDIRRALDAGWEAAKWFPFDPLVYLERSALAGAAVVVNSHGIGYQEPFDVTPEYEFLVGWRNGCPGAQAMLIRALEANPKVKAAHWALSRLKVI